LASHSVDEHRWPTRGLLVLLLLLSFALRLYALGDKALWYDELGTALHTEPHRSLMEVVRRPLEVPAIPAPPLYFVTTYLFRQASEGDFVLRLSSVFCGVLAVAAMYTLGRALLGPREGLLGAFLLSISAFHVRYSQEARYYALLMLLATLSLYFLHRGLSRNDRVSWLGYLVVTSLAIYTHLFAFLFVATEGVFAVARFVGQQVRGRAAGAPRERPPWSKEPFVSFVLCLLAMVLLYLPMVPYALSGLLSHKGLGGDAQVVLSTIDLQYLSGIVELFGAGPGLPLVCYVAALGVGLYVLARGERRQLFLVLLWMLMPFLVVFLVPAGHNFRLRYVIFVLPVFLLTVSRGLVALGDAIGGWLQGKVKRTGSRRATGPVVLTLAAALFGLLGVEPLLQLWREEKQPWDEAAAFLEAVVQPTDIVIAPVEAHVHRLQYFDYSASPVEYLVACPCPAPVGMEDWARFGDLTEGRQQVWLLDPNPNYERIRPERWMAQQLDEFIFVPPVVFVGYSENSAAQTDLLGPVIASDIAVVPVLRRDSAPSDEEILELGSMLAERAEELYPGQTRIHFTLGELHRLYGDEDQSVLQYATEMAEDPRFYYAYEGMALIYARHGDVPKVLQMYLDLLEEGIVRESYYHFLLGSVWVLGGDLEMAVEHFVVAVRMEPSNAYYRLRLGDTYGALGRWDEAMGQYNEVIRWHPSNAVAYSRRAGVFLALGRLAEAEQDYKTAVQLRPESAFPHTMLAGIYYKTGLMEEALAEAREAVRLRDDQAAYRLLLGQIYETQHLLPEAIAEYEEAVRLEPGVVTHHLALAQAYRLAGRDQEAVEAYERVLELEPDNAAASEALEELR
jgi:mannosyltransferase